MSTNFRQAPIPVRNRELYDRLTGAIGSAFYPPSVARFLKTVERAKLRVRDFEKILDRGYLGDDARAAYAQLEPSDQGQVREMYLRAVERVAPELRAKHLKIYAYYS